MKTIKYISIQSIFVCLLLTMASNVYADKYDRQFEKFKRKHHLQVKDSLYSYSFVAEAKSEVKPNLQKNYTWYYNNSLHTTKGNYSGKLLNGVYIKYYSLSHSMAEKGTYKYGLKNGTWYTWAEDGSILTYTEFKKGYRHGNYSEYADSSKLIHEGRFKKDLKTGTWFTYSPDGELLQRSKFKKGKQNGKCVDYEDGVITRKGRYNRSEKKGFWKTYNKTGKMTSFTYYKHDEKNGFSLEKDSLGNKERVCWYKNGKLNGKCKKYKGGKVISVEKYKNGKVVPDKKKEEKKDKTKKEKNKRNKK